MLLYVLLVYHCLHSFPNEEDVGRALTPLSSTIENGFHNHLDKDLIQLLLSRPYFLF